MKMVHNRMAVAHLRKPIGFYKSMESKRALEKSLHDVRAIVVILAIDSPAEWKETTPTTP